MSRGLYLATLRDRFQAFSCELAVQHALVLGGYPARHRTTRLGFHPNSPGHNLHEVLMIEVLHRPDSARCNVCCCPHSESPETHFGGQINPRNGGTSKARPS